MVSDCCGALASEFDERAAARDARRLSRRGPARTTRWLVELLEARGVAGSTLLDIGGGLGALQEGLLRAGASLAVSVDASPSYARAAARRAAELGYAERVERRTADFAAVADEIPPADVVTLDRVICCYPDMDALVARSAGRARRLYGIVVPRDHFPNRLGVRFGNTYRRLRGRTFRAYVHALPRIEAAVAREGLRRVARRRTLFWTAVVFERDAGTGAEVA